MNESENVDRIHRAGADFAIAVSQVAGRMLAAKLLGRESIALDVVRRHETLRDFFTKVLGLSPDVADAEACRMEHATSPAVLDRLVKFVEYFERCPLHDLRWDDRLEYFQGDSLAGSGPDHPRTQDQQPEKTEE